MVNFRNAFKISVSLVAIIVILALFNATNSKDFNFQQFFSQNQNDLTLYAEQFSSQNKIVSIGRKDSKFAGLFYNLRRNYSYEKGNNATFEVPSKYRKTEEVFWKQDGTKIISSKGTGEILLSEYLKSCNMTETDFRNWRMFLKKYNYLYIMKDKSNEFVTIGLTPKTGFIYRRNLEVQPGYRDKKLVKLNENWFYFDEKAR